MLSSIMKVLALALVASVHGIELKSHHRNLRRKSTGAQEVLQGVAGCAAATLEDCESGTEEDCKEICKQTYSSKKGRLPQKCMPKTGRTEKKFDNFCNMCANVEKCTAPRGCGCKGDSFPKSKPPKASPAAEEPLCEAKRASEIKAVESCKECTEVVEGKCRGDPAGTTPMDKKLTWCGDYCVPVDETDEIDDETDEDEDPAAEAEVIGVPGEQDAANGCSNADGCVTAIISAAEGLRKWHTDSLDVELNDAVRKEVSVAKKLKADETDSEADKQAELLAYQLETDKIKFEKEINEKAGELILQNKEIQQQEQQQKDAEDEMANLKRQQDRLASDLTGLTAEGVASEGKLKDGIAKSTDMEAKLLGEQRRLTDYYQELAMSRVHEEEVQSDFDAQEESLRELSKLSKIARKCLLFMNEEEVEDEDEAEVFDKDRLEKLQEVNPAFTEEKANLIHTQCKNAQCYKQTKVKKVRKEMTKGTKLTKSMETAHDNQYKAGQAVAVGAQHARLASQRAATDNPLPQRKIEILQSLTTIEGLFNAQVASAAEAKASADTAGAEADSAKIDADRRTELAQRNEDDELGKAQSDEFAQQLATLTDASTKLAARMAEMAEEAGKFEKLKAESEEDITVSENAIRELQDRLGALASQTAAADDSASGFERQMAAAQEATKLAQETAAELQSAYDKAKAEKEKVTKEFAAKHGDVVEMLNASSCLSIGCYGAEAATLMNRL